jgi:hypothetical protein
MMLSGDVSVLNDAVGRGAYKGIQEALGEELESIHEVHLIHMVKSCRVMQREAGGGDLVVVVVVLLWGCWAEWEVIGCVYGGAVFDVGVCSCKM